MYQVNDDLSIYVTRGDIVSLDVKAKQGGSVFTFPAGSAIRIKVFEKKNCENVVLQKDFAVDTDSESVPIDLTEHDTRIGGIISKPVDYWYEVELNPFTDPQTIIGYDEDGPKVFRLFPEGRDLTDDIQPEDIPIVDAELDLTSQRPIQNQAVARKFVSVEEDAEDHYQNKKNPHTVTADQLNALKRSGGTMTGDINMSTHQIIGLPEAKDDGDALLLGQAKGMFPNFGDFEGKSDTVQKVSGTLIAVDNSAYLALKGLKLYGKTMQDGTPTAENPVELASVGGDGSIDVMVTGKNLIPPSEDALTAQGITSSPTDSGTVMLNGTAAQEMSRVISKNFLLPAGTYTLSVSGLHKVDGNKDRLYINAADGSGTIVNYIMTDKPITFEFTKSNIVRAAVVLAAGSTYTNEVIKVQLEAGEVATEYEPFKKQTLTAQTPNGLPGIPVMEAKNATYTDENGQMWCADEIDYNKGVYVQRIKTEVFDGGEKWALHQAGGVRQFYLANECYHDPTAKMVYSDHYIAETIENRVNHYGICYSVTNGIGINTEEATTVEEWQSLLANRPVTVQYILAEPIETPLSYNEMAAYEALRTYDPNTTVYNDAEAYMMVDYFTPTTPMQVNHGERNAGKILGIDEQGNAVPQDGSEKFAPSGYGLGGLSVYASDPNNVTSNGFYYCDENSYGIKDDFKESVFIHMNRSETEMVQIFVNTLGDFGVRRYLAGAWGEIKTATLSGSGAVG